MATKEKTGSGSRASDKLMERKFSTLHLLVIAVVAVLVTVGVTMLVAPTPTAKVVYVPTNDHNEPQPTSCGPTPEVKEITPQEAISSAEDLIKNDLVPPGVTVKVSNATKEGEFYKLTVSLKQNGRETLLYSYMSTDGKYFYPSVFDVEKGEYLEQRPPQPAQQNQQNQPSTFDAPDKDVPVVKFFVMAFCPFGQQAERGLKPVHDLFGDKVKFEPHYVIYENYAGGGPDYCIENGKYCSMHGIKELNEDIRQLCIYKNYDSDTFWNYLAYVYTNCSRNNIDTCWKDAAEANGIDTAKIESCFDSEGVDLIAAEKALNDKYGVRGSPTVFINDKQYNGGRAPEDYKNAVCSGFTSKPEECSEKLGGSSASSAGGCG